MQEKVTASLLLSLAVALVTLGLSMAQRGDFTALVGVALIACGIALMYVTLLLVERGVIRELSKREVKKIGQT